VIRPPAVVHLIVGPTKHGVVRHAESVASAAGHPFVRAERPDEVQLDDLRGFQVVHIPFTDRQFADRCEAAAMAYEHLTAPLLAAGVALSVTLHDLPAGDSALQIRRRAAYQQVVSTARGLVVQSRLELRLLGELTERARSVRLIPLPVSGRPAPRPAEPGRDVVVLGFVFPDRGYEHTIAELPDGVDLLALGAASAGHEDLPDVLARQAADAGHRLHLTGFLPDAELSHRLAAAGVPVAPNRRVAASASIATWLGHGRRPLVPDTPYSREIAAQWPGTLTIYDPDAPGDLHRAIEHALAQPVTTWLSPGIRPGLSLAEVAAAYDEHFQACVPDAALPVGPGHWTVPGNRWDLLDDLEPAEPPAVSVVIPYYEAQAQLDQVLTALRLQTHPRTRLQVVVADDGSTNPPDLSAADGLHAHLVRQPDRGFRAAAARNLGAAAADGEVLLYLDGDTIPEPDYVRRLSRLPALAPDALTVGRRRHADLTGWSTDRLTAWLTGETPGPVELEEPDWLVEAYRDSADLLHADERSYRHIISAVLGLHRDLFTELGGFSEEFTSYGGEDWELAHRAWVAGAVFGHVPEAVAWHDGPDWAGRADASPGAKNAETLAVTRLIPDPEARGGGQWLPYPAIVVRLGTDDPAAVLATARSAFASGTDCGIWLTGRDAVSTAQRLGDPRIQPGPVPAAVLDRARAVVDLDGPARLTQLTDLASLARTTGRLISPAATVTATRALRRSTRWSTATGHEPAELSARLFGRRDVVDPARQTQVDLAQVDLAHELKQIYRSTRRS